MAALPTPPATTPALYEQDGEGYEATVHAHYFVGGNDWLITECDPSSGDMFGWACLNGNREDAELGSINHSDLDRLRVNGVFPVDMEDDWTPCTLTEAIATLDRRAGLTGTTR